MSRAIGDPEELIKFAQQLVFFTENLDSSVAHLNGAFSVLGESWQDEKRAQFEEEFHNLVQQIMRFEEISAEHVAYLQTLAARLTDYLQS
ncbi:hypothetical protein [Mailhella sp.]